MICAEGYLFELERRGYLQAGAFVPEVVLEFPEAVAQLHREFVRAGSDVVQALTYYAHRDKLRMIGKEDVLERLNREALRIARAAAAGQDLLVAGDICNTNVYAPGDPATHTAVRAMFDEQVALGGRGQGRLRRGRDLLVSGRGPDRARGHPQGRACRRS